MAKKPTYEELGQKEQLAPTPWRMYILICMVGLMITGILGYGFFKGDRMVKVFAPLVDAAMEIKLEATTAHLWLEEIISGDRYADISEVWRHQDQAEWYANAMLEGGKNAEGTFIPLDDAEMRKKIENVQVKLKEYREIAQKRIERKDLSGIGTDIDQSYDHVFRSFLKEADEVETILQQIMAKDLSSFRYSQLLMIVITILLFLAVGISFWHFDNQRVKHLLMLNEANRALQKSEVNLSITLNSIGDAVIATDTDGRVTQMNPIAEKLTGWSLSGAEGRPIIEVFNIINEKTRNTVESPVERVIREGTIVGLANHTVLISKGGDEYLIADSGAPIRNDQGDIIGVVLVFRDDTEKRQMDMSLEKSERRYKLLFESAGDGIYVHDFDGQILDVNQIHSDRLGYSREEFLDMKLTDFISSENSTLVQERLNRLNKLGHIVFESTHIKRDGTILPIETSSRVIEYEETPAILAIIRDISDRKRIEEEKTKLESQLQQAHKMESIGTLAGGIAHDFNNILSPIMIHSEMAMMDLPPDSRIRNSLEQIYKAGERATDMIKQVLAFSRQRQQEKAPIKLSFILKEVIRLLRSSIPTTIDIRYNIKTEADTVLADPTQVHQVLLNLCTNAAYDMREKGGVLEVELDDLNLDSGTVWQFEGLNPGSYLRLTVRDTGQGIGPEVIGKIFDPYFTTKDVGEGTGMGLAVVHGIVKSHGGEITVKSELGKGTAFQVLFPKYEEDIPKVSEPTIQLQRGTERILFVDDEKVAVDAIQSMLENIGYQLTARTSSIEALKLFRNKPDGFDLVITDMTMPNMTGSELAKKIMSIRPDIPIILCTGFSDQIDEHKAKAMGIRAYVMKPIVMRQIANTIREVLDKRD
jgi:PAS domain S-box-containing protein